MTMTGPPRAFTSPRLLITRTSPVGIRKIDGVSVDQGDRPMLHLAGSGLGVHIADFLELMPLQPPPGRGTAGRGTGSWLTRSLATRHVVMAEQGPASGRNRQQIVQHLSPGALAWRRLSA